MSEKLGIVLGESFGEVANDDTIHREPSTKVVWRRIGGNFQLSVTAKLLGHFEVPCDAGLVLITEPV